MERHFRFHVRLRNDGWEAWTPDMPGLEAKGKTPSNALINLFEKVGALADRNININVEEGFPNDFDYWGQFDPTGSCAIASCWFDDLPIPHDRLRAEGRALVEAAFNRAPQVIILEQKGEAEKKQRFLSWLSDFWTRSLWAR